VALVAQAGKTARHRGIGLGGRLARAAGEENHRVRRRLGGARRGQRNLQADLPAFGLAGILGHLEHGALRTHGGAGAGLRQFAVGEFKAAQGPRRNRQGHQEQGDREQSSHGYLGGDAQGVVGTDGRKRKT